MPDPEEGLRESESQWGEYFFSLKTSFIKLNILEIRLVFKLWDVWNWWERKTMGEILKRLPDRELKASGIISSREHILYWRLPKKMHIQWWGLPLSWAVSPAHTCKEGSCVVVAGVWWWQLWYLVSFLLFAVCGVDEILAGPFGSGDSTLERLQELGNERGWEYISLHRDAVP